MARCVIALAAACLFIGCGSKDGVHLISVGGVVLLDGNPVGQAAVMFHHDDGSTAYAVTSYDGSFLMTTREPGDGIVPGSHKVTVTLSIQEGGVQANAHGVEDYHSPIQPVRTTHVVPEIYNHPRSTPLAFDIEKPTKSMKVEVKTK